MPAVSFGRVDRSHDALSVRPTHLGSKARSAQCCSTHPGPQRGDHHTRYELDRLVATAAPETLSLLGLGTQHTATLLIAAGENIDRFSSEAAFAHLCAAAPIPVSSGRTDRHRLNSAGNRAANRALHMIVIVRLRYCEQTKAYMERRTTEGRTKKEVIRCRKRYVAREIYRTLRADLSTLELRT